MSKTLLLPVNVQSKKAEVATYLISAGAIVFGIIKSACMSSWTLTHTVCLLLILFETFLLGQIIEYVKNVLYLIVVLITGVTMETLAADYIDGEIRMNNQIKALKMLIFLILVSPFSIIMLFINSFINSFLCIVSLIDYIDIKLYYRRKIKRAQEMERN